MIQYLDAHGAFRLRQAGEPSGLYFPFVSESGFTSAITPDLGCDAKADQNSYLLEPEDVTVEGGLLSPGRFAENMRQLIAKIRMTYRKILAPEESVTGFLDVWSYRERAFVYYTALCG